MTATDFVGFTRKRMGNPSTDEWTDAELLRFVNMAQERLATGSKIATLETYEDLTVTAALGQTYEFAASDIMYITSVKNTTTGQVVKPTDRPTKGRNRRMQGQQISPRRQRKTNEIRRP